MITPSLLLALALAAPDPAGGTLTGRILYGGDPPAPEPVEVNKDAAVCGDAGLVDRSLVVGEAAGGKDGGRGVANVVVWLDPRASGREPPVAESADPPPVTLDNAGCRFEPHVVLLRTGQELRIANSDPVAHQATAYLSRNIPFNESVPAGGDPVIQTLEKPELVPVPVLCPIHPWMKGFLFVQAHPYAAVTGPDGRFRITGLPPGEWSFRVWQERAGFLNSDELTGAAPAGWDGATLKLTVEAGGTADLGDVTVKPAAFE